MLAKEHDWDEWSLLEHRVIRDQESPSEVEFLRTILRRAPDVRPSQVTHQQRVDGLRAEHYRAEFAIRVASGGVAIEIDGNNKVPGAGGLTHSEQSAFNAREQALGEGGWHLVRYSNHEVRMDRDSCRYRLERALAHARNRRYRQRLLSQNLSHGQQWWSIVVGRGVTAQSWGWQSW